MVDYKMDGITINNVTLWVAEVPYRKQLGLMMRDNDRDSNRVRVVGYIKQEDEDYVKQCWDKILEVLNK